MLVADGAAVAPGGQGLLAQPLYLLPEGSADDLLTDVPLLLRSMLCAPRSLEPREDGQAALPGEFHRAMKFNLCHPRLEGRHVLPGAAA